MKMNVKKARNKKNVAMAKDNRMIFHFISESELINWSVDGGVVNTLCGVVWKPDVNYNYSKLCRECLITSDSPDDSNLLIQLPGENK